MINIQLNHRNFIEIPISQVLGNGLSACKTVMGGMESYPLGDYILPSVFLNMTGFQEQKLKCICWDLATIDYHFRREMLTDLGKLGEFSSYDAKNWVFKKLMKRIDGYRCRDYSKNQVLTQAKKQAMKDDILNRIDGLLKDSLFNDWRQYEFFAYLGWIKGMKPEHFANECIMEKRLKDVYEVLYKTRNRYAHNTVSYQENLPTLHFLSSPEHEYDNIFCWFALLMLIDKIFITLYGAFLETFELYG